MKMLTLILAITAAVLPAVATRAQDTVHAQFHAENVSNGAVKELQKKRIAILKDVADGSLKLAQSSRIELEVALEDRMSLLKAESEAAATEPERIAVYRQALDALSAYEKLARAQKEAARGSELTVLRINARRLEVESRMETMKVKELQIKRIATLKVLAQGCEWMFKSGRASPVELYEARRLLLEGELDAAEKESERIAIYRNMVNVLKEYEKYAGSQRGNTPGADESRLKSLLEVMARRLEAEICLEQARAKETR